MAGLNAQARAVLALVRAGADPASVGRLVGTLDVDDTDTDEVIGVKVEGLKSEIPALFGAGPLSPGAGRQQDRPTPPSMAEVVTQLHRDGHIDDAALERARNLPSYTDGLAVGAQIARDRYPAPTTPAA